MEQAEADVVQNQDHCSASTELRVEFELLGSPLQTEQVEGLDSELGLLGEPDPPVLNLAHEVALRVQIPGRGVQVGLDGEFGHFLLAFAKHPVEGFGEVLVQESREGVHLTGLALVPRHETWVSG